MKAEPRETKGPAPERVDALPQRIYPCSSEAFDLPPGGGIGSARNERGERAARAAPREEQMRSRYRGPSPALIVAMIALVAALAGSAVALPGKNSVDKNDIKKNAVKSKAIKNSQVKAADLAKGSVKTGEIADGAVGSADLAPGENFHNIGAAGEPAFSNGGEGDCIWSSGIPIPGTGPLNPLGFYKDILGRVHLRGVATAVDGAGGDAACDPSDPGEIEDGIAFTLPSGYRPEFLEIVGIAVGVAFVAPDAGAVLDAQSVPAGAVVGQGPQLILDGSSFRAATPAAAKASEPAELSRKALRALAR